VMPDLRAIYDNNFSGYPESSGPLPVLDLCNRETPNPVIGKGPLGKSELYFTYREPDRDLHVVTLQKMLLALGYDLGKTGPKKDGVDGKFGDATEKAVRKYQGDPELSPVDWEGNPLKVDGLVGPRTSDALNRHFVGSTTAGLTYYEVYQTPVELTGYMLFFTVNEKFMRKGLSLVSGSTQIKIQINPK
ncbi:MAG TPA: peptidoglycan-binding protein, partial [Candidatus Methanoperedenaceae archaeon]|nr:peptidoglycan-binding protein [Candidatus Methanoperedenaceae archaeon]